jgi:tetratricopeptide (TPR) repeat protein
MAAPVVLLLIIFGGCKKKVTEQEKNEAKNLNAQGLRYYKDRNFPSAFARFEQARSKDGTEAEYPNNAGMAKLEMQIFKDAHELFQQALKIKEIPMYYVNDGMALFGQGQNADAIQAFEKALKLDPKSYTAQFQVGVVLFQEKKHAEAIDAWNKALAIEQTAASHCNIGLAQMELGKLDEAEAHFKKAKEIDPKYFMASFNLGVLLQKQGKLDAAAAQYQKTSEISPGYYPAYYNLGLVLKRDGKKAEARKAFEQFLKVIPPGLKTQAEDARRQLSDLK